MSDSAEQWQADPAEPYLLTFAGRLEKRPHRFCPSAAIAGADCPNCKKPLLRLLTLQTSELPFWRSRAKVPAAIHLLYCWTCAIPYGRFGYRIRRGGNVEILKYKDHEAGAFGPDGPYDGYTGKFPERKVGLRALSGKEQKLALQLRADEEFDEKNRHLTDPVHQIGGIPMIYNPEEVQCSACGRDIPFFATICDNARGQDYQADTSSTFVGCSSVQMVFHWCAACAVMTAYHSCS